MIPSKATNPQSENRNSSHPSIASTIYMCKEQLYVLLQRASTSNIAKPKVYTISILAKSQYGLGESSPRENPAERILLLTVPVARYIMPSLRVIRPALVYVPGLANSRKRISPFSLRSLSSLSPSSFLFFSFLAS